MITRERFIQLTNDIVIPYLESGYYHPDMAKKYSKEDQAIMAASGETMYGLDRKAGAQLAMYPEWTIFWGIIDKANARQNWKHYYMGGMYANQLKPLASAIMYQWFEKLAAKYLTASDIAKIEADDRLVVHFSYASWNGEGWFKRFAAALRAATGTREEVFQKAFAARTTSNVKAIRQGAANMLRAFKDKGLVRTL